MAYVSAQSVLEEAGLWNRELGEIPAGTANGSNTVFTVAHKPLADNNYDDAINASDVTAYVNGTSVPVASVVATTGAVTLSAAPANGTSVTIDYSYTSINSDFVDDVIEEASEVIDNELSQVTTTPFITIPKTVRLITRTLAAGLLMSREYGLQADEEADKAARAKIKQAEAWLASYRTRLIDTSADVSEGNISSTTRGSLFQRYDTTEGTWGPLADEYFTINEDV